MLLEKDHLKTASFTSPPCSETNKAEGLSPFRRDNLRHLRCGLESKSSNCLYMKSIKQSDKEIYLKMYPQLRRKWINQCVGCQQEGYKPDMPKNIFPGIAAQSLRKYFQPLNVDEHGLCEICSKVLHKRVL